MTSFCPRLAIAGYDAFTIKALMGHRDMKTTERYIRAHRLTRQVALVKKMSTNWPQMNGVNPSVETISISHTCG